MSLEKYRQKRRFEKTPEPAGAATADSNAARSSTARARPGAAGAGASKRGTGAERAPLFFAVQKHAARRLHYDFRLELDGLLLSWAVPKGPSFDPHDRRLATRVEDHPLEYGSFEGTIPPDEYGAGTVELWDRGSWQPEGDPHEGLEKGDLKFTLQGQKLKGSWVLVRMKPRPGEEGKENWLLIKHDDEYSAKGDGDAILKREPRSVASARTLEEIAADGAASIWHGELAADKQTDVKPGEEFRLDPSNVQGSRKVDTLPRFIRPELATLVDQPPPGEAWLHEAKFDGYRIVSRIEDGSVKLHSRNEQDWTGRYQGLADELAALPVKTAMLDGEIVMQLPDGTHSFQALQSALQEDKGGTGGQLVYYVFDLLYLDGYDLLGAVIEERKELLRRLLSRGRAGKHILFSQHVTGAAQGKSLLGRACRLGLEGVVSKKAGSRYRPGARGGDWLKAKCRHGQEFVIAGYTDPAGSRVGFGALLLGAYEDGKLRYVGRVGTGFDERLLRGLGDRLRELETEVAPFAGLSFKVPRGTHWVKPQLVAEVAFAEWTREGLIRHPSFKGLRQDKAPKDISIEKLITPAPPASNGGAPEAGGATSDAEPPDVALSQAQAGVDPRRDPPARAHRASASVRTHQVTLTHPERVFWPLPGLTKRDLVAYYDAVADWMLPYVLGRPIAMVRCPDGIDGAPAVIRQGHKQAGPCFFHKHPGPDFPGPIQRVTITESGGPATYLTITEAESLTALAQMGVLEIHVWGSRWPEIESPDMMVFDLDPDPAVSWRDLADGARLVRDTLRGFGLESFVKTTGGKGLHVVAPIKPTGDWRTVHDFSKTVAERVVSDAPGKYIANMSKAKRLGKIFVDYVRNNRGSTSIAPYSSRARELATVAVPLRWSDLGGRIRPDTYTIKDLPTRLRRLKSDPWEGYLDVQKSQWLTDRMMRTAGIGADKR